LHRASDSGWGRSGNDEKHDYHQPGIFNGGSSPLPVALLSPRQYDSPTKALATTIYGGMVQG
jgi:hypothetical protein